ncbi:flagellar hook assembly protein FlgD [Pseudomonas serbica]|uniref:flagellar hook assembly protein FlgD n=1 Tax=Pseudomonas serbica TaxID=2965074 RepID=UPI00237C0F4B|nr:flagellar hook assembly protein FlgD [Pseudomonas serbica]
MSTMDVTTLNNVNQTAAATSGGKNTAADLQNNFMTLLVTQLKNQDPLKPMENAELTSQLAQINTVQGIQDLNKTMANITTQINTSQQLQATALIGHGVLVPGDRVLVGTDATTKITQTTPFGIDLPKDADNVTVSIVDASGVEARSFKLGAMKAGTESFTWDGKLTDGTVAPDGAYKVKITASTGGAAQDVTALTYGLVSGVSKTADGGALLDLGGTLGRVSLTDVRQVL